MSALPAVSPLALPSARPLAANAAVDQWFGMATTILSAIGSATGAETAMAALMTRQEPFLPDTTSLCACGFCAFTSWD
jgi:hypothetical protein